MGKKRGPGPRDRNLPEAPRRADAPDGPRWQDASWLLLLGFPALVPLAYDPAVPQLKRAIALLLITGGLIALTARWVRAPGGRATLPALCQPMLGVLGAAGLSLGVALDPYEGVLALYLQVLLSLGLLTWMSSTVRSRQQVLVLVATTCLAASLAAGAGIVQYAMPGSFPWWYARGFAIGTTGNPNYLGAYLAVTAPMAAALALSASPMGYRALGLGSLAVVTLGLLLTFTRAAWLAYLGGLAAVGLLFAATRARRASVSIAGTPVHRRALVLLGSVLIAFSLGAAVTVWRGGSVPKRFASIFNPAESSVANRLRLWRDALPMIRDHAVLGVGIGNSPMAFIRYDRIPESSVGYASSIEHLHSEPLALAVELGLVGAIAACWFLIALARLARRAILGREGSGDPLAMGAVGSLVAAGIDSLFFYDLHELTAAGAIWMAIGFLEVLARLGGAAPAPPSDPARPPEGGARRPLWRWACAGVAAALLAVSWWLFAARPGMAAYYTYRARRDLHAGRPSEAVPSLEAALAWDGRHGPAQHLLGQALQAQGRYQEAIRAYQEAVRSNPNDIASMDSMGYLYQLLGNRGEAREMYRRALAVNPHVASTHHNLATLLLAEGKPEEAIGELRLALELSPRHAAAANALAMAYIQLDRFNEAEAALRQAVEFDPSFTLAWLNLYKLRGLLENRGGAAEALAQALRLDPALEGEARRAQFFDRVWATGIALGILPVRAR